MLEQKFRLKLFLKIRLLRSDLQAVWFNDFSVKTRIKNTFFGLKDVFSASSKYTEAGLVMRWR